MKNFAKLLIVAVAVTLIASLFALSASAAAAPELIDPNTLTPGSDRVIFIKDAPRDENNVIVGELEGDGSGSDANNPFKVMDHESFDPSAQYPKYHLMTAFYQATELLKDEGGTIVVCGPVYFGMGESYGSGANTRDVFTAKYGENTIKITSVYDGVDYRETAGAKITIALPAEIGMYGQSIWENVDIETADTYRVISFSNYATLIGEGVNCYPSDDAFEGVAANYVSLSAGHRYSGGVDLTTNLVVKSGTYNVIASGEWGVNTTRKYNEDGNPDSGIKSTNNLDGNTYARVILEGTTKVYGEINGTNRQNSEFSGQSYITINGGTYECDINMVGKTGMINADGKVVLTINGGDFSNAWSINNATAGCSNNLPAISTLDFSGWTGDLKGLAYAVSVVTEFSEIKFAEGLTVEKIMENYEEPTEPAETEPEATEPAGTEPAGTEPAGTEPTATEPEATEPEATQAPADDKDEPKDEEEGGSNMILWIAIAAGVVVVAAIVIIVLKKKKA